MAILRAVDKIEQNYCVGYRLRGAVVSGLCEYRLPGRWRIIYQVDHQRHVPILVILGEHTVHAPELSYERPGVHPKDSLSGSWRWGDLYRETALAVGASREQFAQMIEAIRREDQQKCC